MPLSFFRVETIKKERRREKLIKYWLKLSWSNRFEVELIFYLPLSISFLMFSWLSIFIIFYNFFSLFKKYIKRSWECIWPKVLGENREASVVVYRALRVVLLVINVTDEGWVTIGLQSTYTNISPYHHTCK